MSTFRIEFPIGITGEPLAGQLDLDGPSLEAAHAVIEDGGCRKRIMKDQPRDFLKPDLRKIKHGRQPLVPKRWAHLVRRHDDLHRDIVPDRTMDGSRALKNHGRSVRVAKSIPFPASNALDLLVEDPRHHDQLFQQIGIDLAAALTAAEDALNSDPMVDRVARLRDDSVDRQKTQKQ